MFPALSILLLAQAAPSMAPMEIQRGIFVLPGSPDAAALARASSLGITYVIDLRNPAEGDFRAEAFSVQGGGGNYLSCPMDREPTFAALDSFRAKMSALPTTAKVLVHCATGNRAGGALFAFWVMDGTMPEAEALALAKKAGLRNAATEAAVRSYIAARQSRLGHFRFSREDSE